MPTQKAGYEACPPPPQKKSSSLTHIWFHYILLEMKSQLNFQRRSFLRNNCCKHYDDVKNASSHFTHITFPSDILKVSYDILWFPCLRNISYTRLDKKKAKFCNFAIISRLALRVYRVRPQNSTLMPWNITTRLNDSFAVGARLNITAVFYFTLGIVGYQKWTARKQHFSLEN